MGRIEPQGRLGLPAAQLFGSLEDQIDLRAFRLPGPLDRLLDAFHGMLGQHLQHADEGPGTGLRAVLGLQFLNSCLGSHAWILRTERSLFHNPSRHQ